MKSGEITARPGVCKRSFAPETLEERREGERRIDRGERAKALRGLRSLCYPNGYYYSQPGTKEPKTPISNLSERTIHIRSSLFFLALVLTRRVLSSLNSQLEILG